MRWPSFRPDAESMRSARRRAHAVLLVWTTLLLMVASFASQASAGGCRGAGAPGGFTPSGRAVRGASGVRDGHVDGCPLTTSPERWPPRRWAARAHLGG